LIAAECVLDARFDACERAISPPSAANNSERFHSSPQLLSSSELYLRATVIFRGASRTRRWQAAIAIAAALGLFAAVTTGWATRGLALAWGTQPQQVALSQGIAHVASPAPTPTHQTPTKHAWMTRDRPPTWTRLSSQSVWSPLPDSFGALSFRLSSASGGAPSATSHDQDRANAASPRLCREERVAMDFGTRPPEINSGRIYSGPGSGSMTAVAATWDRLASTLYDIAAQYRSVTATPAHRCQATSYLAWLSATAAQARQLATQAHAAATAYESAFAAVAPSPVIETNRALRRSLALTNCLGQAGPAIADAEPSTNRCGRTTPPSCTPMPAPRPLPAR